MAPAETDGMSRACPSFLHWRSQYRAAREASSGSAAVIIAQARARRSVTSVHPDSSSPTAAANSSMALLSRAARSAGAWSRGPAGPFFEHTLEL